jgi:hypothetical protein
VNAFFPVTALGLGVAFCTQTMAAPSPTPSAAPGTATPLSQALCGAPPADAQSTQNELAKLHAIEKNMPPVKNQAPSEWCFAFSATDIADYYLHQQTGQPYSSANEISPIDAVAATDAALDSIAQPAPAHPGEINLNQSGSAALVLTAIQNQGALRSLKEIEFTPESYQDPAARALIHALFQQYEKNANPGNACADCTISEDDPAFQSQLLSFQLINQKLYQLATTDHQTDTQGDTIDGYSGIAAQIDQLSQTPKIQMPAFQQNRLITQDPLEYAAQLKTALTAQEPVSIGLCSYDLPGSGSPSATDQCGSHAMTAVGEAWVNGSCTIRLRSSWGANWGGDHPPDGYINLPVDQFMKATLDINSVSPGAALDLSWISTPHPPNAAATAMQMKISGQFAFSGSVYPNDTPQAGVLTWADGTQTTGTFKTNTMPLDALQKNPDGSSLQYKGGTLVAVANQLDPSDGSHYTGTVDANGEISTGTVTETDGLIFHFSNGNAVSVQNLPMNGGMYTGTVTDQGDGLIPATGTIQMPDGSTQDYP